MSRSIIFQLNSIYSFRNSCFFSSTSRNLVVAGLNSLCALLHFFSFPCARFRDALFLCLNFLNESARQTSTFRSWITQSFCFITSKKNHLGSSSRLPSLQRLVKVSRLDDHNIVHITAEMVMKILNDTFEALRKFHRP